MKIVFLIFLLICAPELADTLSPAPYPRSPVIQSIRWNWETLSQGPRGNDLWPVTWGDDGHLYTAWGDGFGFDTLTKKRVSLGVGRLEGDLPDGYRGVNIDTDTWDCWRCGKSNGILSVGGVLYMWVNMQDSTTKLFWSEDKGRTWESVDDWYFDNTDFAPATFLQHGKDYEGAPDDYVYSYGGRGKEQVEQHAFLVRVPKDQLLNLEAYEYFTGIDNSTGSAYWSKNMEDRQPVFTNAQSKEVNFGWHVQAVYNPGIGRYILTSFHAGPGGFGVYDAPNPWGPWTTVHYTPHFGGMGPEGQGLSSSFPQKWMSEDGTEMGNIISVWGPGGEKGYDLHDRLNVVKVTIVLRKK